MQTEQAATQYTGLSVFKTYITERTPAAATDQAARVFSPPAF